MNEHLSSKEKFKVGEIYRRLRWVMEKANRLRFEGLDDTATFKSCQQEASGLCFALAMIKHAGPAQLLQARYDARQLREEVLEEMGIETFWKEVENEPRA